MVMGRYAHPEAFTVEEQAAHVSGLPGVLTRNLLMKDKKHGIFFIVAHESRNTRDTKTLGKLIGLEGKTNLRLIDDADKLMELLGVTKGSLSYLAAMNDAGSQCTLCMDKALFEADFVNAHPLRCDRTTSVAPAGIRAFLKHLGKEVTELDFGPIGEAAPPAPAAAASKPPKAPKAPKAPKEKQGGGGGQKKQQEKGAGLVYSKKTEFAEWYPEVPTSALSACLSATLHSRPPAPTRSCCEEELLPI